MLQFQRRQQRPGTTSGLHRSEQFNIHEDECRWPIDRFGNIVRDCNFQFEPLEIELQIRKKNFPLVRLPAGTKIYHATIGDQEWWKTGYPRNKQYGGTWFTSTQAHSGNFGNATHVLEYELQEDATLLFVHNLATIESNLSGYNFVTKYLPYVRERLQSEHNISLDGYVGCNECEIYLSNNSIRQLLHTNPKVVFTRSRAFID